MRSQFVKTVSDIVNRDEKVVLLLGDIGVYGFKGLFDAYPDRIYNIGILEQSTISVSAGLSISGLIPIVHTIAPFIVERALEQIKVDLCYQKLGANLVSVGGSYDYAALGPTHHCPGDVAILNQIPDIEIIVPGHADELDQLFNQNYNNKFTTYFRLSESNNNEAYKVKFGKNITIQEGVSGVVIIAIGTMLKSVLEASADLDVTIIYCTTVKPFDYASIKNLIKKKLIIVEPYYSGPVLLNILKEDDHPLEHVVNIGVPNNFINKYGKKEEIDKMIGLDAISIRARIEKEMSEH